MARCAAASAPRFIRACGYALLVTGVTATLDKNEDMMDANLASSTCGLSETCGKALLQTGYTQDKVVPSDDYIPGGLAHGSWILLRSASTNNLLQVDAGAEVVAAPAEKQRVAASNSSRHNAATRLGVFKVDGAGMIRNGDEVLLVDRQARMLAVGEDSEVRVHASGPGACSSPDEPTFQRRFVIEKHGHDPGSVVMFGDHISFRVERDGGEKLVPSPESAVQRLEVSGDANGFRVNAPVATVGEQERQLSKNDSKQFVLEESVAVPISPKLPRCQSTLSLTNTL